MPRGGTLLVAAVLGGAVGVFAALYLRTVTAAEHLVWDGHTARLTIGPHLAAVVTCALGGVVVGLVRRRHPVPGPPGGPPACSPDDLPHDVEDALVALDVALAEDDRTPVHSARWLVRSAVLGVVSLAAGTSLGPEAPLIVLATGFGQRGARILRVSRADAAAVSVVRPLSGLFGGRLGPAVLAVEQSRQAPADGPARARPRRVRRRLGLAPADRAGPEARRGTRDRRWPGRRPGGSPWAVAPGSPPRAVLRPARGSGPRRRRRGGRDRRAAAPPPRQGRRDRRVPGDRLVRGRPFRPPSWG